MPGSVGMAANGEFTDSVGNSRQSQFEELLELETLALADYFSFYGNPPKFP